MNSEPAHIRQRIAGGDQAGLARSSFGPGLAVEHGGQRGRDDQVVVDVGPAARVARAIGDAPAQQLTLPGQHLILAEAELVEEQVAQKRLAKMRPD